MIGMAMSSFSAWSGYQKLSPDSDPFSFQEIYVTDGRIQLDIQNRTLMEVLQSVQLRSGIRFEISPHVLNEKMSITSRAKDWNSAVTTLLQNYNRVGFFGDTGQLKRVLIAGMSGNRGITKPSATNISQPVFTFPENQLDSDKKKTVKPDHLKDLPPNSVLAINIDKKLLLAMKFGDIVSLDLPSGQHDVIYGRRIDHENGDITWIGRLLDKENQNKVILTLGKNGNFGRILTDGGAFRIESTGTDDWLVDVEAAGITPGGHSEDGIDPVHLAALLVNQETTLSLSQPIAFETEGTITGGTDNGPQSEIAEIDLMVVHPLPASKNLDSETRINNLVAIANQAYSDSEIQLRLRLVHTEFLELSNSSENATALSELTRGQGAFIGIAELRKKVGADLVSLVRPFDAESHGGCGTAWIGGIANSSFHPGLGFSVVSDGIDGRYYCTDYTLAHELGHNMGASHDRDHANYPGKFPYSHGYGRPGEFGTVMSYFNPEVGIFSNPDLDLCREQPCGVDIEQPNPANNALTLNSSRHAIAEFMDSIKP